MQPPIIIAEELTPLDISQGCVHDSHACPIARVLIRMFPGYLVSVGKEASFLLSPRSDEQGFTWHESAFDFIHTERAAAWVWDYDDHGRNDPGIVLINMDTGRLDIVPMRVLVSS